MAELTALESKLGEVLGLAMAAQDATAKVGKLVEEEGHDDLSATLQRMAEEAKETEERTTELASELDGKKTAILEKARETKQEAVEMMSTYLGDDADALDGFEFLTMAEAGEVGHWSVVGDDEPARERAGAPGAGRSGRRRSSSATSSRRWRARSSWRLTKTRTSLPSGAPANRAGTPPRRGGGGSASASRLAGPHTSGEAARLCGSVRRRAAHRAARRRRRRLLSNA